MKFLVQQQHPVQFHEDVPGLYIPVAITFGSSKSKDIYPAIAELDSVFSVVVYDVYSLTEKSWSFYDRDFLYIPIMWKTVEAETYYLRFLQEYQQFRGNVLCEYVQSCVQQELMEIYVQEFSDEPPVLTDHDLHVYDKIEEAKNYV